MRPSIFKLLILFNFFLVDTHGQEIATNTCDSILLTKQEYEKCNSDIVWTDDILIKTNYIINFKTSLLPRYRLIRKGLNIPTPLQNSLDQLKKIHDTILDEKLSLLQSEMDSSQNYVQPKAYLSSLLSFQIFKFYPDIHAILLNDIHLQLKPKTTVEEQKIYKQHFDNAMESIPTELYQMLIKITTELRADNNLLMEQGFNKMFQGSIQDEYRNRCDIINFLLWTE